MNAATPSDTANGIEKQVLFRAGEDGYSGYRIPSLLATPRPGTVLAFAEARRLGDLTPARVRGQAPDSVAHERDGDARFRRANPHSATGGLRFQNSVACSNACASCSTPKSSLCRPTI